MVKTRDLIKKTRLKPGVSFYESSVLRETAKDGASALQNEGQEELNPETRIVEVPKVDSEENKLEP